MTPPIPESIRAVILTPDRTVLLMEVRAGDGSGPIWITPGGRRHSGEDTLDALRRELREETGLSDVRTDGEIWVRHGTFTKRGRVERERERFYLVRMAAFQPNAAAIGAAEATRFVAFRWWGMDEIAASPARFVPRRLAALLRTLEQEGVPAAPVDVSDGATAAP